MKRLLNDREHVGCLSHSPNFPGVKNGCTKMRLLIFRREGEPLLGQIKRKRTVVTTATLLKGVRGPRSGRSSLPSEEVTCYLTRLHMRSGFRRRSTDRTSRRYGGAGSLDIEFPEEHEESAIPPEGLRVWSDPCQFA